MNTRIELNRFSLHAEEGMLAGACLAGGVPGDPEEPGVPDLPAEPGEPTIPDQPPPAPVA